MQIQKNIILNIILLALFLFLSRTSPASGEKTLPIQKGICYAAWDKDSYSTPRSDTSLKKLSETGANYVSIIVTQYQDRRDSVEIKLSEITPSDTSLRHVTDKAHGLGLKVMLKPHIDILKKDSLSCYRGDITFKSEEEWAKWFNEYQKFILHYATLAESAKVEIFCIGTELNSTTGKTGQWKKIIKAIRNAYSGKLVYASNWDSYKTIAFWDELDFIGIDAYFPLTNKPEPSISEIKLGWEKWKAELRDWHNNTKKPIIITEIGYPCVTYAPATPWECNFSGNAEPEIQAKCYEAFFDTMWGCPWLSGVYWWRWDTNSYAGGKHNRDFSPQNKPAQKILEKYYKEP
ncbi:MAG: hypothetical protein PHW46_00475 [Candidatus Omnitrophica bacterium]|nr:hypothetical protein [Candidatus Omnitrophota bacterium]